MPDHLPVHVNRQELHDLSVPSSFETSDSFVIEVHNHGEAGRIHVHLDENLSAVASIDDTNHYVEANGRTEIPVSVHEGREVFGKLKIVSGYGAVTRWVDVVLTEPEDDGVVVDEDLAKPAPPDQRSDQEPPLLAPIVEHPTAPVVVLALVAVLVAIAAASLFEGTLVVAGAIVVVVAVLVSVGQLVR